MPMKLPNGYGSVSKLSGRRRNPYIVRITVGDARRTLGCYHTRKDALSALAEYNRDPYSLDVRAITFADVYRQWYARRSSEVSTGVAQRYTYLYSKCAPIADKPIADLRLVHLQATVDDAQLTPVVSNQLKSLLFMVYQYAIKQDIVNVNYAERVDTGKKPKTQNPHVPFTPQEIALLWEHVGDKFVPCVLILIYTGMRESELVTMRREDVHLADGYMVGGIKTDAGKRRIIPIHSKIAPIVSDLYARGLAYLTDNTSRQLFEQRFAACMRRLGLTHRTHDCRHTFASLMDEAGANRSSLKRIMGHAGGDVTDSVYIHKTVENLKQEIEKIAI